MVAIQEPFQKQHLQGLRQFLGVLLYARLVGVFLLFELVPFLADSPHLLLLEILTGVSAVVGIFLYILLRRELVRAVAFLNLLEAWGLLTGFVLVTEGLDSPVIVMYVILLVIASGTIHPWASAVVVSLTVALLYTQVESEAQLLDWAVVAINLVVVAGLSTYGAYRWRRFQINLRDSRANQQSLVGQLAASEQQRRRLSYEFDALQQQLNIIVDSAPITIFVMDQNGFVAPLNGKVPGAARLSQRLLVDSLRTSTRGFALVTEKVRLAFEGKPVHFRVESNNVDFEIRIAPIRDSRNEVSRVIGVATDITNQVAAEKRVRENVQRLQKLLEVNRSMVERLQVGRVLRLVVRSVKETIPTAEDVSLFLYDRSAGVLTERECVGWDRVDNPLKDFLRGIDGLPIYVLRSGEIVREGDLKEASGAIRDHIPEIEGICSVMGVPLTLQHDDIGVLLVANRTQKSAFDETDQLMLAAFAGPTAASIRAAELQEEILLERDRAAELAVKVNEAREYERRRIAQELHDQLGGEFALLVHAMENIRGQLGSDMSGLDEFLDDSITRVHKLSDEIRSLELELRPPALDDFGLTAALEAYVDRFQGQAGLSIDLRIGDVSEALSDYIETVVFRCVQEGLTNVIRHAQASEVLVNIRQQDGFIFGTIVDDGVGFEVPETFHVHETGMGLAGMLDRLELVGGSMKIISQEEEGTHLQFKIRVDSAEEGAE